MLKMWEIVTNMKVDEIFYYKDICSTIWECIWEKGPIGNFSCHEI